MELLQTPISYRPGTTPSLRAISKNKIIQFIKSLDFEQIFVPEATFASDSEFDTPAAVNELAHAISDVIVRSPPKSTSPRKLLETTLGSQCLAESPSMFDTPTPQFTYPRFSPGPFDDNPPYAGTHETSTPINVHTMFTDQTSPIAISVDSSPTFDGPNRPESVRSSSASTLIPEPLFGAVPGTLPSSFMAAQLNVQVRRSRLPFPSNVTDVDPSEVRRPSPELQRILYSKLDEIEWGPDPHIHYLNVATLPPSSYQYIQIRGTFSPIAGRLPSRKTPSTATPGLGLISTKRFLNVALYDTGSDACVVCDDFLDFELCDGERQVVNFDFE